MARHASKLRAGFSIIEATLAVLLVGGALVAALNVAAAAQRTTGAASDRRLAEQLAHMLMSEVLAQPASDPNTPSGAVGARIDTHEHLLDYVSFSESPMTTRDGRSCGPTGWTWNVKIAARPTETVGGRSLDLKMYHITVRVETDEGTAVELTALRSRSESVERAPLMDNEQVVQIPIMVQTANGSVRWAWPTVRANRAPDSTTRIPEVR